MFEKTIQIVKEAGEIFKEGYYKDKEIVLKGKKDLVTEYDIKVEEFLKEKLKPFNTNFIAEESIYNEKIHKTFIIDPIDGTTNYAHQVPHCAISVAYYENNREVFGIVYNPILNELFYAKKGEGAYLKGKKIEVSKNECFQRALIATGFPYSSAENEADLKWVISKLNKVLPRCQDIRRLGSAALDLCYVACGRYEGFYEINLKPWDVAAGKIIVQEAGGEVSNNFGESYNIFEDRCIVATNMKIHRELVNLLEG
ncbi:inositol monophosphatase family protein [Caminibacter pacificus]